MSAVRTGGTSPGADIPAETRPHLRDLLLTLADNKRLLGLRYADCLLGSPSLETGIAAASMAQDEWGHSRLTYALLGDFGDDPAALEHQRPAEEYFSAEPLDRPFGSYCRMIAAALVLDSALTLQYQALGNTAYAPARNRVQKLLDEEVLHLEFALGWAHRIAGSSEPRDELRSHLAEFLPLALRWFGAPASTPETLLLEAQLLASGASQLRDQLLARLGPPLEEMGLAHELSLSHTDGAWTYGPALDWAGWDERRRRARSGGPDEDAIARVRGDRNRTMLLD